MSTEMIGILTVIAWFTSAIVGALIGMQKGKAGKGAFLGFLFGPVGWILMICDAGIIPITMLVVACIGIIVMAVRVQQTEFEESQRRRAKELAEEKARYAQEEKSRQEAYAKMMATPTPTPEPTPKPAASQSVTIQYPPGVNTPEERRAYWEAVNAAKRAAKSPAR